jgi:hypothetical protein
MLYKNGIRLKAGGADYTLSGNTITFVTAPATGAVLLADYNVSNTAYSVGTNSTIFDETPSGTVNGTTTLFTAARGYVAGSLAVYINGVKQKRGTHFTETTPASGTFTMTDAPLTGDDIMIDYQFNLNPSSNADTVDGIHANATATANQLQPLDANAKVPVGSVYQWAIDQKFGNGTGTRSSKASGAGAAYTAPSINITNPYNKTVVMNFTLGVMANSTTSGQNFQVYMTFDGNRVSSSLYYDYISGTFLSFASPFSFTFTPNQTVVARLKMDGNGSGSITDTTSDDSTGWNPRLVGQIGSIS